MLKAGIYVDSENVVRCGGRDMRYEFLRKYVEAQGATVVRANAYLAQDVEREDEDRAYRAKLSGYRQSLRHAGFRIVPKPVQFYTTNDGVTIPKANADLDLAIDAMLQARNLDYILLVSGEGDFTRLVVALQGQGCRVDVIGFHHVSEDLRVAADFYRSGFLVPGLLPLASGRFRGVLRAIEPGEDSGFVCHYHGLRPDDQTDGVLLKASSIGDGMLSREDFVQLRRRETTIEFSIETTERGPEAVQAELVLPQRQE